MKNDKKTSLGTDGIKAGEHTYNIIDVSSRYFGECYVGMMHGKPVCRGGFYRVVNEMLERRKNGR